MSNPPFLLKEATNRFVRENRPTSGIWELADDKLVQLEGSVPGLPVVIVPSERVLLLPTPLPPMRSSTANGNDRRRRALPFAVEDRIADPLDQVHIALGQEISPGVWLAGVVDHAIMRDWIMRLEAGPTDDMGPDPAQLGRARLVPDALALPVPGLAQWSVNVTGMRAVVRTEDGGGFAVPHLENAWRLAGSPACIAYGDALPALFGMAQPGSASASASACLSKYLSAPALDLRQGAYAVARKPVNPVWKKIALIAGLGAVAQGAIAVADTLALTHLADQRAADVRNFASTRQPPVVIGSDLSDAIAQLTPDTAKAGPGQFIPLLSRTSAVLAGSHVTANWRSVAYDQSAGTLTIEIETSAISDLQTIAKALTSAGFSAQPGAASSENGRAVGSLVIRPV